MVLGSLLALAGPAAAATPHDIGDGPVVDESSSGVASGGIVEAIDGLERRAGLRLVVVFVDDFSDAEPTGWANETAIDSGLTGPTDVLLAIGIEARGYGVSVDQGVGLTGEQLSAAENDDLVPHLQDDEWAEAVVAYARALGDLVTGEDTGSAAIRDTGGGGSPAWLVPAVGTAVLVVLGGAFLIAWLRGRRRRSA